VSHRVLYVENDFGVVGGSARALSSLVAHLDRDLYRPFVTFAAESATPLRETLRDLGCELVPVGRKPLPRTRVGSGLGAVQRARQFFERDVALAIPLAQAIRRHRIELVHANNNLRVNRYAYWAAASCGIPVVAHQRFLFRPGRVDAWHARLLRSVLCISQVVRDSLEPIARTCDVRLAYDGVEVPDRMPDPPRFAFPLTIAAVGRLVAWKGQHVLLRAAPKILSEYPAVRFVLAGAGDGDDVNGYEKELRRLVLELGIADRVEFRGHVNDIAAFYRESVDVVVHTSVAPEPFGLVMAEAMAAGRPLVASDVGASQEIVANERSGLLFRSGDPDALATALLRLLANHEFARELARAGFQRAAERFNVERTARDVAEVYSEILATP
jgi:glycosyltransferase involved in cell wall biosynthesis